jgi:hypothetical protein
LREAAALALAAATLGALAAAAPPARAATCVGSRAHADLDGDGRDDLLTAYPARRACPYLWPWRLRVRFADGRVLDQRLPHTLVVGEKSTCCVLRGAEDLDGDGRDELAILLGEGASEWWFGVFRLAGRRIVPVPGGRERPLRFYTGGSVTHGADTACRTRRDGTTVVVTTRYGWAGGGRYGHREETYAFDGSRFRRTGVRTWKDRVMRPPLRGHRCFERGRPA